MDTVNCLQLFAHQVLISASTELRQFSAFSLWLRQEIEIQSLDPTSVLSQDGIERDANIDHANTLDYIQGAMLNSRLNTYFDIQNQSKTPSRLDLAAKGRSLFELYKKELKNVRISETRLPGLNALINHLDGQCALVFARIAETQRRNVRFGAIIPLDISVPKCLDMRMLVEVSQ